jgi:hypothetical protein
MLERSRYKTNMPLMRPNQRGRPIDPALYHAKSMLAWIAQVHVFVRNKRVEEMDWER